mmetsp:Transcript_34370/g.95018  ORF Transcript_34370/g.95018 Transcript_34370/m.95018 type:complete len:180 (-) Transcript_34370:118-657(-)
MIIRPLSRPLQFDGRLPEGWVAYAEPTESRHAGMPTTTLGLSLQLQAVPRQTAGYSARCATPRRTRELLQAHTRQQQPTAKESTKFRRPSSAPSGAGAALPLSARARGTASPPPGGSGGVHLEGPGVAPELPRSGRSRFSPMLSVFQEDFNRKSIERWALQPQQRRVCLNWHHLPTKPC